MFLSVLSLFLCPQLIIPVCTVGECPSRSLFLSDILSFFSAVLNRVLARSVSFDPPCVLDYHGTPCALSYCRPRHVLDSG